jgi:type 2 lantibiotic biosynthesis protein LanM
MRLAAEVDVTAVIERSATLRERLDGPFVERPDAHGEAADDRLRSWCGVVAEGDWARFAQRLAWEDLDLDEARRGLGGVRFVGAETPEWAQILAEALAWSFERAAAEPLAALRQDRALDPAAVVAFEELLLPFVQAGRRRLARVLGSSGAALKAAAQANLERGLLRRLARIAERTLFLRFSAFRSAYQATTPSSLGAALFGGKAVYDAFLRDMYAGGLARVLEEYAVLGRALATCTGQWILACAEMIQRLEQDRADLEGAYGPGLDLARLCRVEPNRSDPHDGGRSVAVLHFDSGTRLAYKPRSLGLERAFFALVSWLNARGLAPSLRELRIHDRGTHGWAEYVDAGPCASEQDVHCFYERAGMLLALVYAIGGADFHSENLLASGAHPVLIDLEMLMVPTELQRQEELAAAAPAARRVVSVLDTSLLPIRVPAGGNLARFEGGLAFRETAEKHRWPGWRRINTDLMAWGDEWVALENGRNVPVLEGRPRDACDYVEDLTRGFANAYRTLIASRPELLAADGPLAPFRGQRCRFLYRNTHSYAAVLKRLAHPEFLKDGVSQSIELETLKRVTGPSRGKHWAWPLMCAESRALERQDVPAFSVPADGVEVALEEGGPAPRFVHSGFDAALSRLASLSEEDLARQTDVVRVNLATSRLKRRRAASPGGPDAPLRSEDLLEEARSIAETLAAAALPSPTGDGLSWTGVVDARDPAAPGKMSAVGDGLFQGRAGIALFFAALARVTGEAVHRDTALGAARPLMAAVERDSGLAAGIGLGAADGAGGLVYSLARIGGLLERPEPASAAARAAAAVTPAQIRSDGELEVLFGCAGFLLGLLALHDVRPEAWILERAAECGRHLLESRITDPGSGRRTWAGPGGRATTGVPHGSSGIAHALLLLYRRTGAPEYREAVVEAQEFERSLFVPEAGNWREEPGSTQEPASSWCHGAPGIGLVRLAGLDVIGDPAARRESEAAVQATLGALEAGLATSDNLCCGTLGRVELLLRAADRLDRPELRGVALSAVSRLVKRARSMATYRIGYDDFLRPGLFQGLAGIGLSLARLGAAADLPFVPLWE